MKVKTAEEEAAQIRRDAALRVKEIADKADADGEALCDEARRAGEALLRQTADDNAAAMGKALCDGREKAAAAAETQRKESAAHFGEAVDTVVKRIIG